jgi:hypothetical protein
MIRTCVIASEDYTLSAVGRNSLLHPVGGQLVCCSDHVIAKSPGYNAYDRRDVQLRRSRMSIETADPTTFSSGGAQCGSPDKFLPPLPWERVGVRAYGRVDLI